MQHQLACWANLNLRKESLCGTLFQGLSFGAKVRTMAIRFNVYLNSDYNLPAMLKVPTLSEE